MNKFENILSQFLNKNQQNATVMLTAYVRTDGQFDINIDNESFVIANFDAIQSIARDWYVTVTDFTRNTVITLTNENAGKSNV